MTRILALSSSRVGTGGFLEAASPQISQFLGARPRSIAFIPFAAVDGDYEAYGDKVRHALSHLPHTIEVVTGATGEDTIGRCDAVMTGGGNTFKLLHDLYKYGLLGVIKEKVQGGIPYIGWSAGANIAGLTICTTNDMPIIQPPRFDAFGFLPFQLNPHYINQVVDGHNGETRDQRLGEFIMLNPTIPIVGLPEGTGLCLDGGELMLLGSVPAVLFARGKKHPLEPGTSLTDLLAGK
jgi:dipeptidase E